MKFSRVLFEWSYAGIRSTLNTICAQLAWHFPTASSLPQNTEKGVVRLVGEQQRTRLAHQYGPKKRPVRFGTVCFWSRGKRLALRRPSERCTVVESMLVALQLAVAEYRPSFVAVCRFRDAMHYRTRCVHLNSTSILSLRHGGIKCTSPVSQGISQTAIPA